MVAEYCEYCGTELTSIHGELNCSFCNKQIRCLNRPIKSKNLRVNFTALKKPRWCLLCIYQKKCKFSDTNYSIHKPSYFEKYMLTTCDDMTLIKNWRTRLGDVGFFKKLIRKHLKKLNRSW